jgi:hypothetical protein
MSTHLCEHTRTLISISTSERLSQLNFEIYKVGHQEHLAVDGNVTSY